MWSRASAGRPSRARAWPSFCAPRPFPWPIEFPEVFNRDNPGFDALISNPPFQGGLKITSEHGTDYRHNLVQQVAEGRRGSADLCAYFFLRGNEILRRTGGFGLLATNTIAQGDTREVGLDALVRSGIAIPRAAPSQNWPGTAGVEVAHVWAHKGRWQDGFVLDGQTVAGITPFLTPPGTVSGEPHRLSANAGKSFIGSFVLGSGFVLAHAEAQTLIRLDTANRDVIFPYINGEDLNTTVDQSASRWVINFHNWPLDRLATGCWADADEKQRRQWFREGRVPGDYPGPVASDYRECLSIVRERVKPQRGSLAGGDATARDRARRWWQFARPTMNLYAAIEGMSRVLARGLTSAHHAWGLVSTDIVIDQTSPVYVFDDYAHFAFLQSSLHWEWALKYGPTMRTAPRYTPTDCFENFPFPGSLASLSAVGETYYVGRAAFMSSQGFGFTTTYNRFHDPAATNTNIEHLRELHIEMDRAVAVAYGWDDLVLGHGFHETRQGVRFTISEAARLEVLDRLLALNHERYAEEVEEGLHEKGAKKTAKRQRNLEPAMTGRRPEQPDLGFDFQLTQPRAARR